MRAARAQSAAGTDVEAKRPPSAIDSSSVQRAVDEAEADLARGEYVEHDEVMAKLRRWADGT
jgi:predicted transcriptional regulator